MTKIPDPKQFSEADIGKMIADDDAGTFDLSRAIAPGEAFPQGVCVIHPNKGGRPKIQNPKQQISIRLDPAVIEKFKATGKGWQSRMNDVLASAELER